MKWASLVLLLWAAPLAAQDGTIHPDTSAVLVAVTNYWPDSATIYIRGAEGYSRIGKVGPGKRLLIVVPSSELKDVTSFQIAAMPLHQHAILEFPPDTRRWDQPKPVSVQLGDKPPPLPGT